MRSKDVPWAKRIGSTSLGGHYPIKSGKEQLHQTRILEKKLVKFLTKLVQIFILKYFIKLLKLLKLKSNSK